MRPAPTLEDVARKAGVSTATVSRCLNAPEKVVEATRLRVLAAVDALGYAPNFNARALAASRSNTMGAIIPTMENAIFAEGIQAFQDALHARGYTLLIASSSYDPAQEAVQVRNLVARGADGLLLVGQEREPGVYDFLTSRNVPFVTAWSHDVTGSNVAIGFDNIAAMSALVRTAVDLGHKRVGMISAPAAGNDRAAGRQMAARSALGDIPIVETPYGFDEGGAAFEALIKQHPDLTLVVAGNDVLAAGALQRAAALSIEVPGQVSITGFDDIEIAGLLDIATVTVPHRQMGEAAAKSLAALVEGEKVNSQTLPVRLALRGSLAAPRNED